jgi:hypothetical protein
LKSVPRYRFTVNVMNTFDPGPAGWAPAACTLPRAERPLRAAEFSTLFAASLRSLQRIDETHLRLELVGDDDLAATLAELTTRETQCCSFFGFTSTRRGDRVVLDVAVPSAHRAVLNGLARQAAAAAGLAG